MPPTDPEWPQQGRPDSAGPDRSQMDALSEALARVVLGQNEIVQRQAAIENRLNDIEAALHLRRETTPETRSEKTPETKLPEPGRDAQPPIIHSPVIQSTTVHSAFPPPLPPFVPAPRPQIPEIPSVSEPALETQLGLNWLNRVAVITLLLGVAFAFKYAIDNQWIGPAMRVAMGIVAATSSLVIGEWMFLRGQKVFAQGVTGLGLALLYLSFYATFGFYHLLLQEAAFGLMFLTTCAAVALALHYNSQTVAILGLIGGFLTPVLLSTGENRLGVLEIYTLVLNIGALILARQRGWIPCAYLSLAATWVLYAGWASSWLSDTTRLPAFTWISITFLLFFIASALDTSLGLLVSNTALYFTAAYFILDPQYHNRLGAFTAGLAIAHGLLALSRRKDHRDFAELSGAIGLILFTLAIPIQLVGFRITIVWSLEAAALAWLSARFSSAKYQIASWCVQALVLARLAGFDAGIYGYGRDYTMIANRRFLVFVIAAASFWIAARFTNIRIPAMVTYGIGHSLLLMALAMEADNWAGRTFEPRDAVSVSAVAITILMGFYALSLIGTGVSLHRIIDRILGLGLVGLVIVKLYLFDVWTLSRGFRITAFLGLGALLLLVSYLYSRFKLAIESLLKEKLLRNSHVHAGS